MKKIKEVILFSHGDSELLSTWSNVPYLFGSTLEKKGIRVRRVDINPIGWLEKLYDQTVWRVINKLKGGYFNTFLRTKLNDIIIRTRIKKAVKQYPDADLHIFLSFSHSSSGLTNKPVVLFCDWTIAYYFEHFLNRKPSKSEMGPLKRQDRIISNADLVISLFPGVAEYMSQYYGKRVLYLGNVVNALEESNDQDIPLKIQSGKIIFVGNRKYHQGALYLMDAIKMVNQKNSRWEVHFIGMERNLFNQVPSNVHFHGYLDKSNPVLREKYYSLLREAAVIVNTTEKWGAFSSMLEAMYFHTPVITTPYAEFVNTFGTELKFGKYCPPNSVEELAASLEDIIHHTEYSNLCKEAHLAAQPYSWDAYIDELIIQAAKL